MGEKDHLKIKIGNRLIEISYEEAQKKVCGQSLSARRAWIEIQWIKEEYPGCRVALRKESVDRNCLGTNTILSITGRSPQGERG